MNTDAVHMVLNLPYRKRIVNLGRGRIVNREYGHIVHYRVARSTFQPASPSRGADSARASMLILLNTARIVFAQNVMRCSSNALRNAPICSINSGKVSFKSAAA